MNKPLLHVAGLSLPGILDDVSFSLAPGQRLGLVGPSGSGKSQTALAILGLTDAPASGSIRFRDEELIGMPERRLRRFRGRRIAMVFQEPMTALDPLMKIGRQFALVTDRDPAALLAEVGLPERTVGAFPHQLSGGQRQRVLIALALANDPELLICDEPTTALDAEVALQVLDVILRLADERGIALLFISHDLALVSYVCPTTLVLEAGRIVDSGPSDELARAAAPALPTPPPAEATAEATTEPAIALKGVSRSFKGTVAVDEVSLTVPKGQRLGIVGGSGSGKTTLLRLIAGLDRPSSGTASTVGGVQMIFQDPASSLDPRMRVGRSITESGRGDAGALLAAVGLAASDSRRFPHQFSGGQRQRISIARALATNPEILLADEAVSALDAAVRAQILALLDEEIAGRTFVLVTHDLSVVAAVCTHVAVMHHGRIVEQGTVPEIWGNPRHEYTRSLLRAARLT